MNPNSPYCHLYVRRGYSLGRINTQITTHRLHRTGENRVNFVEQRQLLFIVLKLRTKSQRCINSPKRLRYLSNYDAVKAKCHLIDIDIDQLMKVLTFDREQ